MASSFKLYTVLYTKHVLSGVVKLNQIRLNDIQ